MRHFVGFVRETWPAWLMLGLPLIGTVLLVVTGYIDWEAFFVGLGIGLVTALFVGLSSCGRG